MEGPPRQRQPFRSLSRYQVVTEADLIFYADAEHLGYLAAPRGMARYYRDYGMLPPRYMAEQIARFEFTNFDLDGARRVLVDRELCST